MTSLQAGLLAELARNVEFEGIVAELVEDETAAITKEMRNAVRDAEHLRATLLEGKIQAFEALMGSFRRLAERNNAHAPDRS